MQLGIKRNRHVNPDNRGNRPLSDVNVSPTGNVVHLLGYGFVKLFKIAALNGDIDYWATNDLEMGELKPLQLAEEAWAIEEYHRGLKQCCGVERAHIPF